MLRKFWSKDIGGHSKITATIYQNQL